MPFLQNQQFKLSYLRRACLAQERERERERERESEREGEREREFLPNAPVPLL